MSTPATPSTSAWWVLLISAKRFFSSPWTSHSSQSGFERSSAWREEPPRDVAELLLGARRRQRRVAHVVGEVEGRVVHPERPPRLDGREGELLAEARHEVQPAAHVVEEVVVGRRRPLEDQDRADVHVAVRALVRQERGVDRREPVEVGLHGTTTLPAEGLPVPCFGVSASPAIQKQGPKRVLLAAPRGYCAGVDRAVQTVEHALDLHGAPIYVRKEIVHNKHVVEQLTERGAIFVDQETEVPEGEMVVFSAHGVAPNVHENAEARRLRTIDATCPLVTKVHVEARKFAADGYTIVMIGHDGHEEVEGTTGEAPDSIVLVETEEDVDGARGRRPRPRRLHHPDHPLRRRDQRDHRRAQAEVPEHHRSQDRRHLLRDDQPPAGRQGARARVRPGPRDRLDELLQLDAAGRGRPRARRRAPT